MSDADEPRPGTALVRTGSPAEQEGLLLGERFLERVAALDAVQWGRLDAAAQQLTGKDPVSRWRRARWHSAAASKLPVLADMLTVMNLAIGVAVDVTFGLELLVRGDRAWKDHDPTAALAAMPETPFTRQWRSLAGIRERGRSPLGHAGLLLSVALVALQMRHTIDEEALRETYAPVEPVIPLASL